MNATIFPSQNTSIESLPLLYHYSSHEGFTGIRESKSIWLTNIHYQNDSVEYYHMFYLIEKYMKENDLEIPQIQMAINKAKGITSPFFTFSFTESKDLLSQWRGYCPSGGCSFSFASEIMNDIFFKTNKNSIKPELYKCIYSEKEKMAFIAENILPFSRSEWEDPDRDYYKTENYIGREFERRIIKYAPIMKHESFYEEREWRLVYITETDPRMAYGIPNDSRINYRSGKNGPIPYVILPLASEDNAQDIVRFNEVVVGPGPKQDVIFEEAKQLECSSVIKSETTYRFW